MNDQLPPSSIPQPPQHGQGMPPAVQARLLDLNRQFYAIVGNEFDRTRQGLPPGMVELAQRLAPRTQESIQGGVAAPLRLLDVGCGNGRFARALAQAGPACTYTGIDADAHLLALAEQQTADLEAMNPGFVAVDLAEEGWVQQLAGQESFDVVVCLAVLHHFPGLALRARIIKQLAGLVTAGGVLALSTWQFLTNERLAQKQIGWAEVGVDAGQVERGDALLPWNQGAYAVRYVHQLDLAEVQMLAGDAGMQLDASFHADGKEGNLNLYTLWKHPFGE